MKHCMKYISSMDKAASRIFRIMSISVSLTLLIGIATIAFRGASADPLAPLELADALCHAAFRIAAIGAVAGFSADITAKLKNKSRQ